MPLGTCRSNNSLHEEGMHYGDCDGWRAAEPQASPRLHVPGCSLDLDHKGDCECIIGGGGGQQGNYGAPAASLPLTAEQFHRNGYGHTLVHPVEAYAFAEAYAASQTRAVRDEAAKLYGWESWNDAQTTHEKLTELRKERDRYRDSSRTHSDFRQRAEARVQALEAGLRRMVNEYFAINLGHTDCDCAACEASRLLGEEKER